MPKLRCFVAMPFGHRDTDHAFRTIRDVLQPLAQVRRVDRVQHNNNIDKQIVIELEKADIVVADLTYARPSVYWEAGFAEARKCPVIYTVRADHLGNRGQPQDGRVHFDLQMRNIIDWRSPGKRFAKLVRSRFQLLAGPILAARKEDMAVADRRVGFAKLSQAGKLMELRKQLAARLSLAHFDRVLQPENHTDMGDYDASRSRRSAVVAARWVDKKLQIVRCDLMTKTTKNDLLWWNSSRRLASTAVRVNSARCMPTSIETVWCIATLGGLTEATLHDILPNATWEERKLGLVSRGTEQVPAAPHWKSPTPLMRDARGTYTRNKERFSQNDLGLSDPATVLKGKSAAVKASDRFVFIDRVTDAVAASEQLIRSL